LFNITVELKATLSFELHTSPLLVTHVEIGNLRQYEGLNQSSTVNKATSCRTEAFIPESEARFIPIEYFDLIALFVAEDEQCIAKRIQVHILLNNQGKIVLLLNYSDI
jgi:hypothetical protein